ARDPAAARGACGAAAGIARGAGHARVHGRLAREHVLDAAPGRGRRSPGGLEGDPAAAGVGARHLGRGRDPAPRRAGPAGARGAAAVGALALAFASADRLLAQLQSHAASVPARVVRGSVRRAPSLQGAFLRRDLALFSRDWPVLLDLLSRLALWTLLPLALLPVTPLPRAELVRDMLVALTLSLGNDIAGRALPLERHALAWARLSPVGGARWVLRR